MVCFITFLTIYKGKFCLGNFYKKKLGMGQTPHLSLGKNPKIDCLSFGLMALFGCIRISHFCPIEKKYSLLCTKLASHSATSVAAATTRAKKEKKEEKEEGKEENRPIDHLVASLCRQSCTMSS